MLTAWASHGSTSRRSGNLPLDSFANASCRQVATSVTGCPRCLCRHSLGLLAMALTDIRWGKTWREVPQKGIEVMFVLDVSRSMLAEDASPNRLTRAKQQIKDMVDEMAGDRVGLVVFAGDTRQIRSADQPLRRLQTNARFGRPAYASAAAVRDWAMRSRRRPMAFSAKPNDHKAIVVFTDGEDQESNPVEVAKQLYADKASASLRSDWATWIRVHASRKPNRSRRICPVPRPTSVVEDERPGFAADRDGNHGAYIPAGTRRVNMADVYHNYVANVEQTEFETAKINAYIARYQWFAVPALALLLLEVFVSTRPARVTQNRQPQLTTGASEGKGARVVESDPIGAEAA